MSMANKFMVEEEEVVPAKAVSKKVAPALENAESDSAPTRTQSMSQGKPVNTIALAQSAAAKLRAIRNEINDRVVEREAQIDDMLRGLVCGKHMLVLGPPGTGKSYMIRELQAHIEKARKFEWLLNRTSDPAEVLGPFSIKGMEKDEFKRVSKGKLPEAHVAFLDEIYKCNEPTLNILLPILNEGIFFNDGKAEEVDLRFMIGASNEEPEDESLAALHDRLVFRHWVDYVKDTGNRLKVMKISAENRNPNINTQIKRTMVSLEELDAIRAFADTVMVPDAVIKTFEKLMRELGKKAIVISDRRMNAAIHIMQANAALDSRNSVSLDDMQALIYVLWEKKEDIKEIEAEILKLVNPYDSEIKKLFDKALEIRDKTLAITSKTDRAAAAVDAKDNLEKLIGKLDKVIKDANANGKDITSMQKKRTEIVKINDDIIASCLGIAGSSVNTPDTDDSMPF